MRVARHQSLATDQVTSARLGKVPQSNTSIEKFVRRYLHRHGLRFRTTNTDLPGSPDIANRRNRWAIFVNGCFWHHHEACRRATIPKRNRDFWVEKFRVNRIRDGRVIGELEELGFTCRVIWECEVKNNPAMLETKLRFLLDPIHTESDRAKFDN